MANFSIGGVGINDLVEAGVGVVSWMHFSTAKWASQNPTGYQLSEGQLADALLQSWVPKSVVTAILGDEHEARLAKGSINLGGILNMGVLAGAGGLLALDFLGGFVPGIIKRFAKPALRGLAVGSAIGGLFDDPPNAKVIPMKQERSGQFVMSANDWTGRMR